MSVTPDTVLNFWREAGYERWFSRDVAFDARCRADLLDAHHAAARRELEPWMDTRRGCAGAGDPARPDSAQRVPRQCACLRHRPAGAPLRRARDRTRRRPQGRSAVARRSSTCRSSIPSRWPTRSARSICTASLEGEAGEVYLGYARRHRDVIAQLRPLSSPQRGRWAATARPKSRRGWTPVAASEEPVRSLVATRSRPCRVRDRAAGPGYGRGGTSKLGRGE